MGQFFGQDKIKKLEVTTATSITLPSGSKIRIGGQGYTLSSNIVMNLGDDIDTGAVASYTLYYVYLVAVGGVISLKYSLSSESPDSIVAYRLIGNFTTDGASEIENIENNLDDEKITDSPGKISSFAMGSLPEGYLPCDGRTVSRTVFAKLFNKLGTAHGAGDGSTTFHLPDLRGRFLRGADEGAGRDADVGTRVAANAGGNAGDSIGSIEDESVNGTGLSTDLTGGHQHVGRGRTADGAYPLSSELGLATDSGLAINSNSGGAGGPRVRPITGAFDPAGLHSHSFSGAGIETRPMNANVKYAIKY